MSTRYTMPAEWEKHSATLLAWPHNKADWPDKFTPIPWVYGEIIRYLTAHERVVLIVKNEAEKNTASDVLTRAQVDLAKVDFHLIPTNRIWMRDSGPILVRDNKGKLCMLDWRFNAWAKYKNHQHDDKIPAMLEPIFGMQRIQPMHKGKRVVLEGGSIDVNGKGTLITTEECLLSQIQCRNPGFTRDDYEEVFSRYLGIDQVLWMDEGIVGDDTHGHVDDITRFVNKDTIVTVVEPNKKDDNHARLNTNLKRLKKTNFNIVELPMPKPLVFEDQRLPASYANFLIANGVVLVPTFNDVNDRLALNILAECFPKRDVVGIHCVDFVWGLGTIHCMSQQIPA